MVEIDLILEQITYELNDALDTPHNFFSVTLEWVPAFKKWYVMTNLQPYINYEMSDTLELTNKDHVRKIIIILEDKIRNHFKEKDISE
jgi:hypothetical protein